VRDGRSRCRGRSRNRGNRKRRRPRSKLRKTDTSRREKKKMAMRRSWQEGQFATTSMANIKVEKLQKTTFTGQQSMNFL